MDGALPGLFPGSSTLDCGIGEPGLEAAYAIFGINGEENFVRISAGMWPMKDSHHSIDRDSVFLSVFFKFSSFLSFLLFLLLSPT